nr:hypothetical protein Iba_chr01cCG15410 [Ipomoea batatas]GMC54406.1 hypothetical protein Iba_chr01dCG15810 [Ipomoea batatas]GMC55134.1 hypothetical protein Iba_chr01eCG4580 [Ipomoea batatas]
MLPTTLPEAIIQLGRRLLTFAWIGSVNLLITALVFKDFLSSRPTLCPTLGFISCFPHMPLSYQLRKHTMNSSLLLRSPIVLLSHHL